MCGTGDTAASGLVHWKTVSGQRVGCVERTATAQKSGRVVHLSDASGRCAALNDFLVHDPCSKARYIVPPILCDTTTGKQDYGEKPQSFLCLLHQSGEPGLRRCNAGRSCNQLHVDRDAVRLLRGLAAAAQPSTGDKELLAHPQPQEDEPAELRNILDPVSGGRLVIPYRYTSPSEGRAAYARGEASDYGLCTAYLQGGCGSGRRCGCIHAQASYVQRLRAGTPCCPLHDQSAVRAPWDEQRTELHIKRHFKSAQHSAVPLGCVSVTRGLLALPEGEADGGTAVRQFSLGKVCRLHRENRCVYGRSCNNIHLCRKLSATLLDPREGGGSGTPSHSASSVGSCSVGWCSSSSSGSDPGAPASVAGEEAGAEDDVPPELLDGPGSPVPGSAPAPAVAADSTAAHPQIDAAVRLQQLQMWLWMQQGMMQGAVPAHYMLPAQLPAAWLSTATV